MKFAALSNAPGSGSAGRAWWCGWCWPRSGPGRRCPRSAIRGRSCGRCGPTTRRRSGCQGDRLRAADAGAGAGDPAAGRADHALRGGGVSAVLFVVFIVGIVQAAARGHQDRSAAASAAAGRRPRRTTPWTCCATSGCWCWRCSWSWWPLTKLSVDECDHQVRAGAGADRQAGQEREEPAAVPGGGGRGRGGAAGTSSATSRPGRRWWWCWSASSRSGCRAAGPRSPPTADTDQRHGGDRGEGGQPQAPVPVDVYEDLQCPICNNLEQSGLTKDFDAKIKATTIKVNYHVMSFLDSSVQRQQVLLAGGQRGLLRVGPEPGGVPEVPRHRCTARRDGQEQPAGRGQPTGVPDSHADRLGQAGRHHQSPTSRPA